MFYSLKVNDDAKPEWKDHYLAYTKGAGLKGHISVSHTYNEETKEVICVESITGTGDHHIGSLARRGVPGIFVELRFDSSTARRRHRPKAASVRSTELTMLARVV